MQQIGASGDVRILYEPRASDTCVVTFSHMDFVKTGAPYWGRNVLAKLGLSAVGIVCDTNTWFPAAHMKAALAQSGRPWKSHRFIVTYGSSMGAYAALRFGRAVGAGAALAMAPQASIDPSVSHPVDLRYDKFFDPVRHRHGTVQSGIPRSTRSRFTTGLSRLIAIRHEFSKSAHHSSH